MIVIMIRVMVAPVVVMVPYGHVRSARMISMTIAAGIGPVRIVVRVMLVRRGVMVHLVR